MQNCKCRTFLSTFSAKGVISLQIKLSLKDKVVKTILDPTANRQLVCVRAALYLISYVKRAFTQMS